MDLYAFRCREAVGKILAHGHSRIPVYAGNPKNIIGLLLVSLMNQLNKISC